MIFVIGIQFNLEIPCKKKVQLCIDGCMYSRENGHPHPLICFPCLLFTHPGVPLSLKNHATISQDITG